MKKVFFILISALFFLNLCSGVRFISDISGDNLRIHKIKKYESFYLIEGARNDSVFKIIAVINGSPIRNEKIQKGKMYNLILTRAFPPPNFVSINEVSYFEYDGVKIQLNKKHHRSVYYAKNLNGLFFIKEI